MDKTEFNLSLDGINIVGRVIFDGLLDEPKFIPEGYAVIGKPEHYSVISGRSLPDGYVAMYEYILEA